MHPRIQEVVAVLDAELAALSQAVQSVPEPLRSQRPAPDRWSVAEILEHLALVEQSVLKGCTRQFAAACAAGLPDEAETSPVRDSLPPERVANRARALQAPDPFHPRGAEAADAWADVEAVRVRFHEFVRACDGRALEQVSFPHPMLGPLNLYQWLLFVAGHQARHAAQIREIAEQFTAAASGRPASDGGR